MTADEDIVDECEKPCSPDSECSECSGYWCRMINEGYWDERRRCWTHKGWREFTK